MTTAIQPTRGTAYAPAVKTNGEFNPLLTECFPRYIGSDGKFILSDVGYYVGGRYYDETKDKLRVPENDVCSIEGGILNEAAEMAWQEGINRPIPIGGGYDNVWFQIINPDQTREQRANSKIGNTTVKELAGIYVGGMGNLDAMNSQFRWDTPYLIKDIPESAGAPWGPRMFWDYRRAAEEHGIDIKNYTEEDRDFKGYTWQDMVYGKEQMKKSIDGKDVTLPFTWTLSVKDGKHIRDIDTVDEIIPGITQGSIRDGLYMAVGYGVHPYNPQQPAILIIGSRGASSAIGPMLVNRGSGLRNINKGTRVLKAIDKIADNVRVEGHGGFQVYIPTRLVKGKGVGMELPDMKEVIYNPHKDDLPSIYPAYE
jgi:hypothetical protein